ncbi:hypothetical protein MKW94_002339 [Papaver nudicaule]|uniref:Uncharacterized protein n=1 Tax=Papaver nudicaule TaxID=74823 RepID=A0AA41VH95_PAPNU|nr:hypothetical protein [Papaver nudicaule]
MMHHLRQMSNGFKFLTRLSSVQISLDYYEFINQFRGIRNFMWNLGFLLCVLGNLGNFVHTNFCVIYNAVGSYKRIGYIAQGSGSSLIMPVVDIQLKTLNPLLLPANLPWYDFYSLYGFLFWTPLSKTEAIDLAKDVFASEMERDIYTGNRIELWIVNTAGTRTESVELRND